MTTKRMLFIGDKESFIIRVLIGKVRDAGVDCVFVPCTVNSINENWQDTQLLAFYIDDAPKSKEEVIHFLTDSMEERGAELILIGEQLDLEYVSDHIPEELVYRTFSRPVDNQEFVDAVSDYFTKVDAGEFRKSILIVDDDPQYLSLVRQWLKEDYKVAMANSGLQAIKYLGKNKVDLILLDHEMPITTGPQVLEMLRNDEETKDIPVIFLTGKGDKESVMAVVALRPEGYFLKDITKGELLEKLDEFFILHR
ncbi:response regulator [Butyrivibrio sp. WCD2001]|uniref:response regulator n=1 Tax=Butyrivibrio sp. WCD2001 TaxID=1280681 RepID=UPI0005D1A9D9|nr:response regulator [Butyrivibrio sp. WCD2001]